MKIAYLILCHRDPRHVARLALKLMRGDAHCAVFIHVDGKSDMFGALASSVGSHARITLVEPRIDVYWCGYSQIEATYLLLHAACARDDFDRFVILQGADYPIRSPAAIRAYFSHHRDREFIRACDASAARMPYLSAKACHFMFMDRRYVAKRLWNRFSRMFDLRLRRRTIAVDGAAWHLHFGAAQIAFTRPLADLFLAYEGHPALLRRFRTTFGPEETYFHTIAFNSAFRARTMDGGVPVPETPAVRLADTRAICYFEYPTTVTVFTEADFERLRGVEEPFIRKLDSTISAGLLDRIDAQHYAGEA